MPSIALFLTLSLEHTHIYAHALSLGLSLRHSNKGFQRDSLSLIVLLKFPFTFSCSSLKPSVLICTTVILKDLIINMLQNTNGLKSAISTHCHVTLIYSLSVRARCAAGTNLTKSHRLALIPACQPVSRDQLLFLFDYRGLCSCAAGETLVWITISLSGMRVRRMFAYYISVLCLQPRLLHTSLHHWNILKITPLHSTDSIILHTHI